MKKVLATLLAVLLLTCVFGTVASAADAPWPKEDPNNYEYGHSTVLVPTDGKTTVKDDNDIQLDMSSVDKPDNGEIERYLNDRYVAKPPVFTVRCVNPFHMHAITDDGDLPFCEKGWVKSSNYTCDGGSWKVVENNGNVVKAQWYCPYQSNGKHDIFITITYKPAHTHTPGEWTTVKEPTCTEKGQKVQKCTGCGETLDSKEIPVNPDKHPENAIELRDTCNTGGNDRCEGHQNYCTKCKNWIGNVEAHTYPANPYDSKAATENETGYAKYKCEKCWHVKIVILPKLDHTHVFQFVNAKEPSCTSSGNYAYQVCTDPNCAGKFFDMQGNEVDWNAGIFRRPLGHSFVSQYAHVNYLEAAATCTTPAKYYVSCNRPGCGASSKGTDYEATFDSGDAKGHVYADTDWVTDGPVNHKHFCLRYGNLEYDGVICDAASIEATMKTEPHNWGEWHAVANMRNVEECQCTKCTEKQTRTVGCSHMWTEIKREPTCLDEGYQADKCIKCGLIVREQVLPALGHDWGEWEVVTPATTEAEGLEKRVCKRDASHVETRPIAKLEPTPAPTEEPTAEPTAEPTVEPTAEPTMAPTAEPTAEPTAQPTVEPTKKPDKTDIPKTGDNSHFGYAYLMIAVAAAGLVVLAATRRKEGSK